jgi:hypothetical protein
MSVLEIQSSTGVAPPERHSDRIVASWLRHMAQRNALIVDAINEITRDPHARDGNPKAQKRLEAKVKARGRNADNPGDRQAGQVSIDGVLVDRLEPDP